MEPRSFTEGQTVILQQNSSHYLPEFMREAEATYVKPSDRLKGHIVVCRDIRVFVVDSEIRVENVAE